MKSILFSFINIFPGKIKQSEDNYILRILTVCRMRREILQKLGQSRTKIKEAILIVSHYRS